jgi:hypothetical protein
MSPPVICLLPLLAGAAVSWALVFPALLHPPSPRMLTRVLRAYAAALASFAAGLLLSVILTQWTMAAVYAAAFIIVWRKMPRSPSRRRVRALLSERGRAARVALVRVMRETSPGPRPGPVLHPAPQGARS